MGVDARGFPGEFLSSIPPLRISSLLPHDLCHGWSASRRLPTSGIILFMKMWNNIAPQIIQKAVVVQSLSHVWLFVTPWTHQTSLSITISQNLLKLMSIESVMPSNHLILSHLLLLLSSMFPSLRVFSSESALHIRWPKFWSFSFSICPSNDYSGLISFRTGWFDLVVSKGLSRVFSSTTVQKHEFFAIQPSLWSNS